MSENLHQHEQKTLEQQIQDVLASSSDSIKKQLQEQLKERVVESLTWSLRDQISDQVRDFMQSEEMKADIAQLLVEAKPVLLAELRSGLTTIVATVVAGMVAKAQENLTTSYKLNKIIEGLF